jgi:hypothetical protein
MLRRAIARRSNQKSIRKTLQINGSKSPLPTAPPMSARQSLAAIGRPFEGGDGDGHVELRLVRDAAATQPFGHRKSGGRFPAIAARSASCLSGRDKIAGLAGQSM